MNRRIHVLLLVSMIPGPAAAQVVPSNGGRLAAQKAQKPPATSAAAADEDLPRWDAAGFFGWRGVRVEDTEYNSRQWDARFVYGGTAGYYWTTNLKLEADVSATAPSSYATYEPRTIQGATYPFFVRTDHRVTTASIGGLVIYQFFENASFHPFVGAGAAWITQRERISTQRQSQVVSRGPSGPYDVVVISEASSSHDTDSDARAQMIAGFKAYPGERVFFRTDVLWSAGAGRFRDISLRVGAGVDF